MMDLGDVVLSEASRSQKDKPCALGACRGGPQWSHTHRGGWRRQGLGGQREGRVQRGHGAGLGRLGPGVRQRRQLCNENALSAARPCT